MAAHTNVKAILAAALAVGLGAAGAAEAQITVAGTNLVNLRADNPTAGTATWSNTGTLGDFAKGGTGTTTATTVGGVPYVSFPTSIAPMGGTATPGYYTGPNAPASITGANTRTAEVWVRNPTLTAEETTVAWGRRGGPDGTNDAFNYGSSTGFGAFGGWGAADAGYATTPAADVLHYLVFTYDGTSERFYVDGTLSTTNTFALDTHNDPNPFRINAQNADAMNAVNTLGDGILINTVRVSTGVLGQAGITANYAGGQGYLQDVPEPASLGLIGLGAAGLLGRRRRASV